jgi:predicted RecB family endonuclease
MNYLARQARAADIEAEALQEWSDQATTAEPADKAAAGTRIAALRADADQLNRASGRPS